MDEQVQGTNPDQMVTLVNNLREMVDNVEIESSVQWNLRLSDAKTYTTSLTNTKRHLYRVGGHVGDDDDAENILISDN